MAKVKMCGIWITGRMAFGTVTTSVLCLIGCLSCFSLMANATCFDDYDWNDFSCSRYTNNLFITGSFLLIFGATVLIGGLAMFFQLRQRSSEEELLGSSSDFSVHTSDPYEKIPQEQPPSFYS